MACDADGRRAFTLVELLVATAILSLVMLAVYRSFAAGMACCHRIDGELVTLDEARAFLSNVSAELRCTVMPALGEGEAAFAAAPGRLVFYTSAPLVDRAIVPAQAVTKVTYEIVEPAGSVLSANRLKLRRTRQFFSGGSAISEEEGAIVLSGLDKVQFMYLAGGSGGGPGTWRQTWEAQDKAPRAVKVRLTFAANGKGSQALGRKVETTAQLSVTSAGR